MIKIVLSIFIVLASILVVKTNNLNAPENISPEEVLEETPAERITPPSTEIKETENVEKIEVKETKQEAPKSAPVVETPAHIEVTSTPVVVAVEPVTPSFEEINILARSATLNILCSTKGGELSPISGTGIMVSSSGLILTNAHIGQYLLLKNFRQTDYVDCVVRTGSPAYPKYKVELAYISSTWVNENKTLLDQENPKGTGENDYAFLRITGAISGTNENGNYPFLPMNIREVIERNEPVLLSSYPAGFLGGLSILQDLNMTSAITYIEDVFTFKETTIDLLSVPGTVVSQRGSSGGAVVDKNATLIGIISTSSDGETTSERELNAITLAHINRSLQSEMGMNLPQFLAQDMESFAKSFGETVAPSLSKLIIDELNKN